MSAPESEEVGLRGALHEEEHVARGLLATEWLVIREQSRRSLLAADEESSWVCLLGACFVEDPLEALKEDLKADLADFTRLQKLLSDETEDAWYRGFASAPPRVLLLSTEEELQVRLHGSADDSQRLREMLRSRRECASLIKFNFGGDTGRRRRSAAEIRGAAARGWYGIDACRRWPWLLTSCGTPAADLIRRVAFRRTCRIRDPGHSAMIMWPVQPMQQQQQQQQQQPEVDLTQAPLRPQQQIVCVAEREVDDAVRVVTLTQAHRKRGGALARIKRFFSSSSKQEPERRQEKEITRARPVPQPAQPLAAGMPSGLSSRRSSMLLMERDGRDLSRRSSMSLMERDGLQPRDQSDLSAMERAEIQQRELHSQMRKAREDVRSDLLSVLETKEPKRKSYKNRRPMFDKGPLAYRPSDCQWLSSKPKASGGAAPPDAAQKEATEEQERKEMKKQQQKLEGMDWVRDADTNRALDQAAFVDSPIARETLKREDVSPWAAAAGFAAGLFGAGSRQTEDVFGEEVRDRAGEALDSPARELPAFDDGEPGAAHRLSAGVRSVSEEAAGSPGRRVVMPECMDDFARLPPDFGSGSDAGDGDAVGKDGDAMDKGDAAESADEGGATAAPPRDEWRRGGTTLQGESLHVYVPFPFTGVLEDAFAPAPAVRPRVGQVQKTAGGALRLLAEGRVEEAAEAVAGAPPGEEAQVVSRVVHLATQLRHAASASALPPKSPTSPASPVGVATVDVPALRSVSSLRFAEGRQSSAPAVRNVTRALAGWRRQAPMVCVAAAVHRCSVSLADLPAALRLGGAAAEEDGPGGRVVESDHPLKPPLPASLKLLPSAARLCVAPAPPPHTIRLDSHHAGCWLGIDAPTAAGPFPGPTEPVCTLRSGTQYTVWVVNTTARRLLVSLCVDGSLAADKVVVPAEAAVPIERPTHAAKRFTFYREEIASAGEKVAGQQFFKSEAGQVIDASGLRGTGIRADSEDNGLVELWVAPEQTARDVAECVLSLHLRFAHVFFRAWVEWLRLRAQRSRERELCLELPSGAAAAQDGGLRVDARKRVLLRGRLVALMMEDGVQVGSGPVEGVDAVARMHREVMAPVLDEAEFSVLWRRFRSLWLQKRSERPAVLAHELAGAMKALHGSAEKALGDCLYRAPAAPRVLPVGRSQEGCWSAGSLGMGVDRSPDGVHVTAVVPGGPAHAAGVVPGMRIIAAGRRQVSAAKAALAEEMAKGPRTLTVTGPESLLDRHFDRITGPLCEPSLLLAAVLYTQEAPETDQLLGFTAPAALWEEVGVSGAALLLRTEDGMRAREKARAERREYLRPGKTSGLRRQNAQHFGAANTAVRGYLGARGWQGEDQREARLKRHVGFLASLQIAAAKAAPPPGGVLYRGCKNFPPQVFQTLLARRPGDFWGEAAPTSTTKERRVAEEFALQGKAANRAMLEIHGVRCGLPVHLVSAFPDEAEVLLPPLTRFRVKETNRDTWADGDVFRLSLEYVGHEGSEDEEWLREVGLDSQVSSETLLSFSGL